MLAESLTLVVDEKDQSADVKQRSEVQQLGLWHRVVGVWLVDQDDNMLLQERKMGRGLDDGMLDSSASGHVDPGEDYVDTVIREAREELGVELNPNDLEEIAYFRTETFNGDKNLRRFTKVFLTRVARSGLKLEMKPDELSAINWYSNQWINDMITRNPERTVPGFVIAKHIHNGTDVPDRIAIENNLHVF